MANYIHYLLFPLVISPAAIAGVQCLQVCDQDVFTSVDKTLVGNENEVGTTWNSDLTILPSSYIRHTAGYNYNVVEYVNNDIVHREGKFNFIKYDDYIQLAMFTSFKCGDYYVPYSTPSLNDDCSPGVFTEGSESWKGTSKFAVKLRVGKKMINGTYSIDTLIARYWMSSNDWGKDALLANYYFKGSITVPETCIIDPGEVFLVNLGEVSARDFLDSNEGVKPNNYVVRPYELNISCSNGVSENAKIAISLTGQVDSNYSDALASSNPSVGVIVEKDGSGQVWRPNDKSSTVNIDLINGVADFKIWPYPSKVSSDSLSLGPFESNAVLRFDFE